MALRILATFMAALTFGILFNAQNKELLFCGIAGAIAWLTWELLVPYTTTDVIPGFAATVMATAFSRFMAIRRKNPITVYLIGGIIPLVPGSGIFYTVYYLLLNETQLAYKNGIETITMAGVISLGIMAVLSLPYTLFSWVRPKDV